MKTIAHILSFYFIALTFIPCSDEVSQQGDEEIQASISMASENSCSHEAGHLDLCTPFCQCNCCHTHTTEIVPSPLLTALLLDINKTSGYTENLGTLVPHSIHHPPRI